MFYIIIKHSFTHLAELRVMTSKKMKTLRAINWSYQPLVGFPGGAVGKESTCLCRRCRRRGFDPWVGEIPWRRKWQPTPVFLPEESHGQRSLVGYSPWGHKELDITECTHTHIHTHTHTRTHTNLLTLTKETFPRPLSLGKCQLSPWQVAINSPSWHP